MSRPRKPFGAQHPGRLPSTMIKVLAAELTEPGRLRKGKGYARDGSVTDIVIERGQVVVEVQGSRPTPYIATIEVTEGNGMPLKRDLQTNCTCPDDDNWEDAACKHVVAGIFVLADEFLLEPELLDVWRGNDGGTVVAGAESHAADPTTRSSENAGDATQSERLERARRHLRLVSGPAGDDDDDRDAETAIAPEPAVEPDPIADDLLIPAGAELPEITDFERIEHPRSGNSELHSVLSDALRHARLDWG